MNVPLSEIHLQPSTPDHAAWGLTAPVSPADHSRIDVLPTQVHPPSTHANHPDDRHRRHCRLLSSFLFNTTGYYVLAGIAFMLSGILIIRFTVLPRIYVCPPGATCPHSFDPHGQILQIVQTVMLYWLRIGCLISGFGLAKLIAYQAWLVMNQRGNTIGLLELNFASMYGRTGKAILLATKDHRNRAVATLALAQIAIIAVVPLVVNRSISNLGTAVRVRGTFTYPAQFTLPDVSPNSILMRKVFVTSNPWIVGDNQSNPLDFFHGTFIFRDNRTLHALSTQPGGSRLVGTVSCTGENVSSVLLPEDFPGDPVSWYNVSYGNQWTVTGTSTYLSDTFWGTNLSPSIFSDRNINTVFLPILWSSNTSGVIVNGTTTRDGQMHLAICTHTIDISPIPDQHLDHVEPSQLSLSPEQKALAGPACASGDDDMCLKVYMGYVLIATWGFSAERLSNAPGQLIGSLRYCQRGTLTFLLDRPEESCVVDSKTWTASLATLAEAVMEASEKRGVAHQDLWVLGESVSRGMWWLQAIIPGSTLVLYIASLGYISNANRGYQEEVVELTVSDVVSASLLEQPIQDYARRGYAIDSLWVGGGFLIRTVYKTLSARAGDTYRIQDSPSQPQEEKDSAPTGYGSLQHPASPSVQKKRGTRWRSTVFFLLRMTGFPAFGGILFMFMAITILRFTILPRIYTCPGGATCHHSFDPHGPIIRVVQTVMLYWLYVGCLISGVGLIKLASFHGWLLMVKAEHRIKTLELVLATTHGSAFKALLLFLNSSHKALAGMTLLYTVVIALIPLIVNRSIPGLKVTGSVKVTFAYPEHFALPGANDSVWVFGTQGANGYAQWLLDDGQSYPVDQFSGTFVVRDNRTISALNAQPGGSRVRGTLACSATNISTTILPSPDGTFSLYNITYGQQWTNFATFSLIGFSFLNKPFVQVLDDNRTVAALHILWMSNSTGIITNGTTTSDGKAHATACVHTIELERIPVEDHLDLINPAKLFLTPESRQNSDPACASGTDDEACMAFIIANYLWFQWSGVRLGAVPVGDIRSLQIFCQRGAWSVFGDPEQQKSCRVDAQGWATSLMAATDALVQTSQRGGSILAQDLSVAAESISRSWWWLQAVVPCAVLVLYMTSVVYVSHLDQGPMDLEELSLAGIVSAVATGVIKRP